MIKKRYVIVGTSVYGIENMGDEALLSVLVRELKRASPGCFITWVARHKNEKLMLDYGIDEVILGLEHETKLKSEGRWFNGLNKNDDTTHLHLLADRIRKADVLIIGGDPFQQITISFNRGLSPYAANLISLAKFLDTKIVLYSIHMGALLTNPYAIELTKFCIENVNLTLLREQFSLKILEELNIDTTNCKVVADSAWAISTQSNLNNFILELDNFDASWLESKIIGVNIRHNYWQWSEKKWGSIKTTMANFLDNLTKKYSAKILFIPNCTYKIDHTMEDDRAPHQEIFNLMLNKNSAYQIKQELNLSQTLSLFPHLWSHISNRRHSAIFAAVHRIPVLPLGGSWHVRPAFEEVNMGRFFLEPEFWTSYNLISAFEDIDTQRPEILKKYNLFIPDLIKKANTQGDLIAKL